jgi:hypothetical protein
MGIAFWCRHLVATGGVVVRKEGATLVRVRIARGTDFDAISVGECMYRAEGRWCCRNGNVRKMNESY